MYNPISVLEVMLYKEVVLRSVEHFYSVHLVIGVIDMHLSGLKETKLKVEMFILCIYLIRCCVRGNEGVQVVIRAICQSKEVL